MPKGGEAPVVPGYTVHEHRRGKGKHGGFAMIIRHGLNIVRDYNNEFA